MRQKTVRTRRPRPLNAPDSEATPRLDGRTHHVVIYMADHCLTRDYALEIAGLIRTEYPHIQVRIIDLVDPQEPIPEIVFATPTYLLDGRYWSLGNPSPKQVRDTLNQLR